MATSSTKEVTQLLLAWSDGDQAALDQIIPLVYGELHRLARRYMQRERVGHALQTTALINEAYLRLVDWKNVQWQNRAHFFGVAAQLMRRILVDCARSRRYAKRGGKAVQVSFEEVVSGGRELVQSGGPTGAKPPRLCVGEWTISATQRRLPYETCAKIIGTHLLFG
jgi:ECF sigma factor